MRIFECKNTQCLHEGKPWDRNRDLGVMTIGLVIQFTTFAGDVARLLKFMFSTDSSI